MDPMTYKEAGEVDDCNLHRADLERLTAVLESYASSSVPGVALLFVYNMWPVEVRRQFWEFASELARGTGLALVGRGLRHRGAWQSGCHPLPTVSGGGRLAARGPRRRAIARRVMRRSREDFVAALENRMGAVAPLEVDYIDVNAGELHRAVGGYPGPGHNMPGCCAVMKAAMKVGDVVLGGPPSGIGEL